MGETLHSIKSGEVARLIPVIADNRKEQRVTSVFLATLSAVPDFAQILLASVEQRVGIRTTINSFTEVVLKDQPPAAKDRPDGLVTADLGRKSWSALIEAKIGSAQLDEEQVERYLKLARNNGIDALITISNQFVSIPSHSPIDITKTLMRKVDMFHWSWKFILTEAILLQTRTEIRDPDQAFILREFIRFLSHESVGVGGFERMPPEWSEIMTHIQGGVPLRRYSREIGTVVEAWHQEVRDLSLRMSLHLAVSVENKIPRSHAKSQEQRLKDDSTKLADKQILTAKLQIPDAAADISVVADLNTKTLRVGMELEAPQDRQRTSARVNWLLRQLKNTESDNIYVRVIWTSKAQDAFYPLANLREDPNLVSSSTNQIPRAFQIFLVTDDGRRFAGRKTFIEELERAVPAFYDNVGQHLQRWQPPPPKPVEEREEPSAPPETIKDRDEAISLSSAEKMPAPRLSPGNVHTDLLEIPEFLKRN